MGFFAAQARRALPYTLLLALGLGAVVVAGAHLSNAFPSEEAPFGWPGPAAFENAVAMVRSDLVLATSVPALILGARALAPGAGGSRPGAGEALRIWALHAALLALATLAATAIGAWGAAEAPRDALVAFWSAHVALALSFHALAFAWGAWLRSHALAAAAATWVVFLGVYEAATRVVLFRTVGYHELARGGFPDWFWTAQAFSPLSSYRGTLILWRPRFRDYVETRALEDVVLPAWLTPAAFLAFAAVAWMLLPLLLGLWGAARRDREARGLRHEGTAPGRTGDNA